MAVSYRDVATNSANSSGVTVSKPTGTIDGDLMIAHFGVQGGSASTLSGWTLIRSDTSADSDTYSLFYKRASSEGSSYAWTSSGTAITGAIMSFPGAAVASPIGADSGSANASSTSCTSTTITPLADSMICLFAGARPFATTYSGQTIATSDPGLVEKYEIHAPNNGGDGVGIAGAVAVRSQSTGTGTGTTTLSGASANVGQLISISPGLDATHSADLFTLGASELVVPFQQNEPLALGATLYTNNSEYLNTQKGTSTWTNTAKS